MRSWPLCGFYLGLNPSISDLDAPFLKLHSTLYIDQKLPMGISTTSFAPPQNKYNDGSLQGCKHHILLSTPIIWSLNPKKVHSYSRHHDLGQNNDFCRPLFFPFDQKQMIRETARLVLREKLSELLVEEHVLGVL